MGNKLIATVVGVLKQTPDVLSINFLVNGKPLPAEAGQYISVYFDDTNVTEGKAYSLSSCPGDENSQITVKRVGLFSNKICNLKMGDTFEISPPYGFFDAFIRVFAMIGLATPNFWLGTMLIYFLSVGFGVMLNAGNYVSFTENPVENLKQLISPVICMAFSFSASVMRTTRSSLLEEINKEYAQTARAKGNTERKTIFGHALRNALIPVITLIGYQVGYLFGGVVIIEQVFALPGLGRLLLNGINQRDYALVQGTIVFIAAIFVLVNLITDITYGFADPRIRYE